MPYPVLLSTLYLMDQSAPVVSVGAEVAGAIAHHQVSKAPISKNLIQQSPTSPTSPDQDQPPIDSLSTFRQQGYSQSASDFFPTSDPSYPVPVVRSAQSSSMAVDVPPEDVATPAPEESIDVSDASEQPHPKPTLQLFPISPISPSTPITVDHADPKPSQPPATAETPSPKLEHIAQDRDRTPAQSSSPTPNSSPHIQWQKFSKPVLTASRSSVPSQDTISPQFVLIGQANPVNPNPDPSSPSSPTVPSGSVIELKADKQEYDEQRQILTAEGNVVMRYQGAVLDADRIQISLLNRQAIAEGNTSLVRGAQRLLGDRLEFNYGDGTGQVYQASGELYLKSFDADANPTLPNNVARSGTSTELLSQRLLLQQPLQNVTRAGQISVVGAFGAINEGLRDDSQINVPQAGGNIRRFRYEADRIVFDDRGWEAINLRLTNDPFSPPELEIRTNKARVRSIGPYEDELYMRYGRLVFDQKVPVPLLFQRYVINRRQNNPIPGLVEFGYDAQERGGFYVQRTQTLLSNRRVQWTISPQFYVQAATSPRAFRQKQGIGDKDAATGLFDPDLYGFRTDIQTVLGPETLFRGFLSLTSLSDLESNLRARLSLRHNITSPRPNIECLNRPTRTLFGPRSDTPSADQDSQTPKPRCRIYERAGNHVVTSEYIYRERIFNGSLGFQNVQQSFGAILTSPIYQIGQTGVTLTYQAGARQVSADTDRLDLLPPNPDNLRVSLGRFQGSVALSRYANLWAGKPLPATAEAGLKYSSTPIVPYMGIYAGLTGVGTYYTSNDTQNYLQATLGFQGQLGHFSKRFLDYTGFNLSLVQTFSDGESPFFFDRIVDERFITAGLTQQLFGPIRVGAQTSINLETNQQISTDYTLEYSRRTYSITLRFNPVQEIGSINLVVNDFNWIGGTDPFSNTEARPVEGGIIQIYD